VRKESLFDRIGTRRAGGDWILVDAGAVVARDAACGAQYLGLGARGGFEK
jgi:hypothetical protein